MRKVTTKTYPAPLSRVCLGTGALGDRGLTGEGREWAFSILDAYYCLGGRFLDTANIYGRWGKDNCNASERVIGMWLSDRNIRDMTVATKACHFEPDTPHISRVDRESLLKDAEESLAAFKTDKLDILFLHRDNEELDIRAIVDFCVPAVEKGLVTRFGFSNFKVERVKTAIEYMGEDYGKYFVGVSNEQSLAMDGADDYTPGVGMIATNRELISLSEKNGFILLPYSSIAHGFFSKLQKCGAVYENGWQNTEGFWGNRAWLTDKNGEAYNKLLTESEKTGISVNGLSLRYLLMQKNTIPIMSVSRAEQLNELLSLNEIGDTNE